MKMSSGPSGGSGKTRNPNRLPTLPPPVVLLTDGEEQVPPQPALPCRPQLGNVEAAENGPPAYGKRVVGRKVHPSSNRGVGRLLRPPGLWKWLRTVRKATRCWPGSRLWINGVSVLAAVWGFE